MRVIGTHSGCGGNILYYSSSVGGYRKCEKCGADGKYGRVSPNTEEEVRRWALGVCHVCQRRHEWGECDGA